LISFVVPAHNEERVLSRTLASIRRSAEVLGVAHEVVVVDDASTDATRAIAERGGARVVGVQFRQIAATRNAGAREARGELLIFVDADTAVNPEVVGAALRAVATGAVGGGCAVRFDGRLPLWTKALEATAIWATRMAGMAAGCFLFCTRRAFETSGGFDETMYAGEEAALSARLKRLGRFAILPEEVLTSGRKFRTHSTFQLAWTMAGLALRGRRGLRDRRHLDLWYGERRADPDREEGIR
jgi:glycosyltransferase involved in cell wall biosynthesis